VGNFVPESSNEFFNMRGLVRFWHIRWINAGITGQCRGVAVGRIPFCRVFYSLLGAAQLKTANCLRTYLPAVFAVQL
jgi:hypothetical protein